MVQEVRTDVVVVGAGNAALVAALAAREQGARVVVLEAAPEAERGGNSRFSGGIFRCPHDGLESLRALAPESVTKWADRVTVEPYPAARYLSDLDSTSGGRSDDALIARLVADSFPTLEWMRDQGVKWQLAVGKLVDPDKISPEDPYVVPGGGALRATGEGVGLMANLFAAVERAGIEVWYGSPLVDLLVEGNHVSGVVASRADGLVEVRGAVVLASGGFGANPELRQRYLGPGWDLVKVRGSRFNQGVTLMQALRRGMQAAGHWGGCHASPLDADAPAVGDLRLTDKMSRYSYPYALLVNLEGHRFVDEGENEVWLTYAKTGDAIRRQPDGRAFQIFDQKTLHLLEPRYRTGTPVESDTLAGLAQKLGLPVETFLRTVEEFNAGCRDGEFDPFSKDGLRTEGVTPPKSNWANRITEGPFVAYGVTCGITFTYGGLKIDDSARVHDAAGRVMTGVHATGELTGGFFYHNYPAGSGLMRGAVFGRLAGQGAAAEAASLPAT